MYLKAVIILSGFTLDILAGDPHNLPHPVKVMGYYIRRSEKCFRTYIKNERAAGFFMALSLIFISWAVVYMLCSISWITGIIFSVYFIYSAISLKDLKDESMEVYQALESDDIEKARVKVGMIVGRDTKEMNKNDIIRATVETVAENTVDGIISPLFYAFLGGAPLAVAYKAVSTLDSMVGYKNEAYINFGYASAKIDDIANYIPARISIIFMTAAAFLSGGNAAACFKTALKDGRKNPSPNSGFSEAAMAGALEIQLGGLNYYHGKPVMKDVIGSSSKSLELKHIKESIKISYITSILMLITGIIILFIIEQLLHFTK